MRFTTIPTFAVRIVVENNALSPKKNDTLNKALEDQKAGKNLLEASQNIVRLTNEDRSSNLLIDKLQKGTITDSEKQQLAGLLNQYAYELQTMYGYSEQQAAAALQGIIHGTAFVASAADARAYNEAVVYLKTYSVQSGQAAHNILPSGTQDYGQAVASWNQYAQDNNLTPEQVQEGMNRIAIGEGPSWGTTYKVHPVVQAGGDVSFIRGYTLSGTIDDNHISVNQGDIYSIGAHGGASIGLSFGPYFPGLINSNDNDYSINGGFGVGAVGLSTGKDGVSFTFGFGLSWGWSATEIKGVDVNGTSTSEVYRYDFK